MGSNFYLEKPIDLKFHGKVRTIKHIGKLALAGHYCFRCNKTLCKRGDRHVHDGYTRQALENVKPSDWYMFCPKCGDAPTDVTVNTEFRQQRGVRPCNSFSWAITPNTINRIPKDAIIVDSMGEKMMVMEFIAMLKIRCPIQLTDAIWKEFS